jgi:phage shock protein A
MSLFSRAHDILAAKANKALDSVENPNEMLDYSYQELLDYVTRIRQALVGIAAERKRIELQEPKARDAVAHLDDQAKAALGQGREDLASEALSRKATAQQRVDELAAQRQELSGQEHRLQATLGQLERKVSEFRSQKDVMKAEYTVAQASDLGETGEALVRAQDKIATAQARAGALDELAQPGGALGAAGSDEAEQELDEAVTAADIDQQLAALKAKLAKPELPPTDPPAAPPA